MTHTEIPISPELHLGALTADDLDDLVYHINDPVIFDNTLTVPFPYQYNHAEDFLMIVHRFEAAHGLQKDWVIRYHGRLIGGIGVMYNFGIESHKSEIGYWLSRDYRGRGLMCSAISAFCAYLFAHTQLIRLEAHVFVGNEASARVLEKNHFVLEGIARATFVKNDTPKDTWQYARVKDTTPGASSIPR